MIKKFLSQNDTGENGTHQAGMLIPKRQEILSFFPLLDKGVKNPRTKISFHDEDGSVWQFNFIYYNNKFFGGTRNEYRLTGMTKYIKSRNLKEGDAMILDNRRDQYFISFERKNITNLINPIKLSDKWITVKVTQ